MPGSKKPGRANPETECETVGACPVVAMGASAGGLEVFQKFFDHMPPESGMSFVLIQHIDPNHETLIPELLVKHTSMPVLRLGDATKVEPNHVYVVPADSALTIKDCTFRIIKSHRQKKDRMAIDHFLKSLAEDQKENVVAIILTGIGTDGSIGLRRVKENGGLTLAQAPDTARYDSMPRSAISTGMVDHVLPVEEMPAKIVEYIRHLNLLRKKKGNEGIHKQVLARLPKILEILHEKTGHDFRRYKQSTLVRRIQRRMQVMYTRTAQDYQNLLQTDLKEVENLFKDLLIGVTQFFRDPEAFQALETHVVPQLFKDKRPDQQIRIWVPGCATGEEAYSIAITLHEQLSRLENPPKVQIFGTDLDEESLECARKARYSNGMEEQVSSHRLRRYFVRNGSHYEVVEAIREMCIFSLHNLVKDPPFSRLDLISCRNLLIYLEVDLQKKLLPVFHYALNPCGFLFLGPSENIASRSELFRCIDKKSRIFQRNPTVLKASAHLHILEPGRITRATPVNVPQFPVLKEQGIARTIERVLLEEYSPPSVIVNEAGEILYFSGRTGVFLEPSAGAPTTKLASMVRKELRPEVRTAMHRAINTRQEVIRENLGVKLDKDLKIINLVVRPLTEVGKDAGLFIVIFQELIQPKQKTYREIRPDSLATDHPLVQQLENELRTTREDLQTTIEELETSNEELKSANEELLSMNEELQSTNEELQTSKEELQSVNEELQRKVEELDIANSDLQNLFQSTQIATIFLDNHLHLKKFSPAAAQLFGLMERDMGRSFPMMVPDLSATNIARDVEEVLLTFGVKEEQISLGHGQHWFIMRVMPYRTIDQIVQGVVITFINISELKQAQEQRNQLAAIVEGSQDAILSILGDGTIDSWNRGAEMIYGYRAGEALGKNVSLIIPPEEIDHLMRCYRRILMGENVNSFETVRVTKDQRRITVSATLSPIRNWRNEIVAISSISRDITQGKQAALAIQQRNERLQLLAEAAIHLLSNDTPERMIGGLFEKINSHLGIDTYLHFTHVEEENQIRLVSCSGIPESVIPHLRTLEFGQEIWGAAAQIRQAIITSSLQGSGDTNLQRARQLGLKACACHPLLAGNRLLGTLAFASRSREQFSQDELQFIETLAHYVALAQERVRLLNEVTDRAARLQESESRFRNLANAAPTQIWQAGTDKGINWVNKGWLEFTGRTLEQEIGKGWLDGVHPEDSQRCFQTYSEAFEARQPFKMECRVRRQDGCYRWVLTHGIPIISEDEIFRGYLGSGFEIHERKEQEEELREQTRILEVLNKVGSTLSAELDLQKLLQVITDAGTEITGAKFGAFFYNSINAKGESYLLYTISGVPREAFSKFPMPRNTALFSPTFRGEGILRIDDVLQDPRYGKSPPYHGMPEGHLPVRSYLAAPVLSRSGEVLGGLFFGHPEPGVFTPQAEKMLGGITAQAAIAIDNAKLFEAAQREIIVRKEAELALRESEEKYRSIFDTAGISIWEEDFSEVKAMIEDLREQGVEDLREHLSQHPEFASQCLQKVRVLNVNRKTLELFGASSKHEILGSFEKIFIPERMMAFQEELTAIFHRKTYLESSTVIQTLQGQKLSILFTMTFPPPDGDFRRVLVTMLDITERKKAEDALVEAQKVLSHHAVELEKQVALRTSDLKETVQSLEGVCYTIAHDLRAPLRAVQGFTQILLDECASSFTEEGREYADRIVRAASHMDLLINDLLRYAKLSHLELPLQPLDLNIEVSRIVSQLSQDIESLRARIHVSPMPTVLDQVLTNLLSNALKFTKAGVPPEIDIRSETAGRFARIFVRDNGIGIDPAYWDRIFQLFQRLHSAQIYPGTGVGLAIVRKGVERMGGQVGLQSTPGEGSSFYFELQLAP